MKYVYSVSSLLVILDLHNREIIVTRRLILKTDFAKHRKMERRISRHHFVLKLQHMVNGLHTVRITDLSNRGTFVNGRKIGKNETITLFDDDVISIVYPNYQCEYTSSLLYHSYGYTKSPAKDVENTCKYLTKLFEISFSFLSFGKSY